MNQFPPFLNAQLAACPSAGSGVHRWLYSTARNLHAHLSPESICQLLKQKSRTCGRRVSEKEIQAAVESSARTAWQPKNVPTAVCFESVDLISGSRIPAPAWPEPNLDAIREHVAKGFGLYDLWEASPVRWDDEQSHAEDIADGTFPGDPLLCCGKAKDTFATRRRECWRGHLARLPLICPNPMLDYKGRTQDGKLSEHSKAATAARIYLVIEFDFSEFARDGVTESIWAPLVREWRADSITVADACAALHRYLATRLPLVLATHSGNKSLHGWYQAFNRTESALRAFMEGAVFLGGDRANWLRSQFCRVPDGLRDDGRRQTCFYFDPEKAVRV